MPQGLVQANTPKGGYYDVRLKARFTKETKFDPRFKEETRSRFIKEARSAPGSESGIVAVTSRSVVVQSHDVTMGFAQQHPPRIRALLGFNPC